MTEKPDCREKVLFTWAETTYSLQRVDFTGWDLGIDLLYRTPYAQEWKKTHARLPQEEWDATELARMAGMIKEQSAAYLTAWLAAIGGKGSGSTLEYKALPRNENECGWEELTFRLREMGKAFTDNKPLMAGPMSKFEGAVKNWSKRLTPVPEDQPEQLPPS